MQESGGHDERNWCSVVPEGRIVGIDLGEVRIGVAVSDPLGFTAQPREVIQASSPDADAEAIGRIVDETGAVAVVVGLPLNQHGEVGDQAKKILQVVERLRDILSVPVETQDERFTTAMVERSLIDANISRKRRKQVVDKLAAQQILQTYLDRRASRQERPSQ